MADYSDYKSRLEITMPRITIDERKANEQWILRMRRLTKQEWIWVETGNIYDFSGIKIVPHTLKGYVELAGIVRKQFMKALVGLPRDGDWNEQRIWALLDEIDPH